MPPRPETWAILANGANTQTCRGMALYGLASNEHLPSNFTQSLKRAKFLNADFRDIELLNNKPHSYKAIISMGYYPHSKPLPYEVFYSAKNGCKKIVYFIGTDVLQLLNLRFLDSEHISKHLPKNTDHIFCNAPWLQEELQRMNIKAELLYCPVDSNFFKGNKLPDKYTIAYYTCPENHGLHNEFFIFEVAKSCPDIRWKFFGNNKNLIHVHDLPKHIEYFHQIPERKMPEFINSTSAILRITNHDGFPGSLAEWALCERPFITNLSQMKFAQLVDVHPSKESFILDKEKTIKKIREVQTLLKKSDFPDFLRTQRNYYKDLLEPEKFKKRIYEVCGIDE